MSDSADDRRSFPRAPIELKVTYKKLNTFFHDYTKNISKGGTFIRTPKPLNVGTRFLFKLVVPELAEPITLTGWVKWVVTTEQLNQTPDQQEPGMGILFLYETIEERQRIEQIVERLMKKHLGELAYGKLLGKDI